MDTAMVIHTEIKKRKEFIPELWNLVLHYNELLPDFIKRGIITKGLTTNFCLKV